MLPCRGWLRLASLMVPRSTSGLRLCQGASGLAWSYLWPQELYLYFCLSPHFPSPGLWLSPLHLCLSFLDPVFRSPSLLVWRGVGLLARLSVGHSILDFSFPTSGEGGARLPHYPSIRTSLLFHPWLTAPPSVSLLSQAPRIVVSLEPSSPSPDRLPAPEGHSCPFSCGRGRWEGAAPSPGPGPATPSPPARLYKANRPLYSAGRTPRGRLIWCGGSAGLWGRP